MATGAETYDQVAAASGLNAETMVRYVRYMRARWGNDESLKCQTGYAHEWARRFLDGVEFEASDSTGQALLRQYERR